MSKARDLSNFISDATVDATEIADLAVTHAKLHTDMNLSSKTLTFAADQISGNAVNGGVISNFASTGIDDNASSTAVTILSGGNVGIGTSSPSVKLHVDGAGSQPELRVSQNSTYFTDYGVNHIDVNGPNDLRFLMGGSEKVRITSDGYIQANSQSQIRLTLGSVGTPGTNTANWIRGTGNSLGLNAASDNIHFEIGGSEKFKITASGGALFNNGQDINQNFTVKSSGNAASLFIDGNGGHISVNRGNFSGNPTGSKLNVFGDGEVLRLDGTGNTSRTLRFRGVSTSNPGVIMADGSLEIMNEDANTSIALLSERDITIKTTKSNGTAGHVKFYSYNTEVMRIDGGNNKVGIGAAPLDDTSGTLHVGGGLSVGSGNHAGYHVFSQHEGNIPANTTRDVLQFEGPAYARYMTVTISGYLCRKEQYFAGYQSWDGASNGNNVGSTVNGTTTFSTGTNSSDARAKIQLECTAVSGTSGHPRYKVKIITGGVTGQLYDTTVVIKFYNPPYYPSYL